MDVPQKPTTLTRRSVLDWAIGFCSAVLGGLLAVPALMYLWPATHSRPVQSREEAGKADDWKPWTGHKISVADQPVLVFRMEDEFKAFSAVCTHLGCLVEFQGGQRRIFCPCHAGAFDLDGQVTGGPPPAPLREYKVAVVDNTVYVTT